MAAQGDVLTPAYVIADSQTTTILQADESEEGLADEGFDAGSLESSTRSISSSILAHVWENGNMYYRTTMVNEIEKI